MSKIEWTEKTWNPIIGCSLASPGCTNCYAMSMAARLEAMARADNARRTDPHHGGKTFDSPLTHYLGTTQRTKAGPVWTGKVALAPEKALNAPTRRLKPTMYFVNSMSDLFHEDVSDEWILRVLDVVRSTGHDGGSNCGRIRHSNGREGQHVYQVLTKRSVRMRDFMRRLAWDGERLHLRDDDSRARVILRNLWLGVSTEDQRRADERIPDLLATPAAVRFVSAEPLLGQIDFSFVGNAAPEPGNVRYDALTGHAIPYDGVIGGVGVWAPNKATQCARLDWIIVGGESGPGARPMHPDWARSIRDQCSGRDDRLHLLGLPNVPFFFKQWGRWLPSNDDVNFADGLTWAARHFPGSKVEQHTSGHTFVGVGKARAGRLLDGREWNEMPTQ